jgi:prepilin-type processing-associated H-X9-DG protein
MAKSAGLSLVEMLAVMTILTLLATISLAGIQSVRETSRRTVCCSQMAQVSLALHQFELSNGNLPPTITFSRVNSNLHWQAMALPFVEQANLFDEIKSEIALLREIYRHPHQLTTVPIFQCQSNPDQKLLIIDQANRSYAFTDYCGVAGVDIEKSTLGIFPVSVLRLAMRVRLADIFDGLSNTFCFGERPPNPAGKGYGRWLGSQETSLATIGVFEKYENFNHDGSFTLCLKGPIGFRLGERGQPCSALHHWSYHPGGANFARMDGSVGFIPYSIDPEVLKALSTRDGGEAVDH